MGTVSGHCTSVILVRARRKVPRGLPGTHEIAGPKKDTLKVTLGRARTWRLIATELPVFS